VLAKLQQTEATLATTQARRDELQQQLDQAVELYNVVQGTLCSSSKLHPLLSVW